MISDFYCSFCGYKTTIPRDNSEQREKYHIKTMHCFNCDHETPFIEIRDIDLMSKVDMKAIRNGIMAHYFKKYGYDFLKLMFYVEYCTSYQVYLNIVSKYIHPYLDMAIIFKDIEYLKKIMASIKERHVELYLKMKSLVVNKTIFTEIK